MHCKILYIYFICVWFIPHPTVLWQTYGFKECMHVCMYEWMNVCRPYKNRLTIQARLYVLYVHNFCYTTQAILFISELHIVCVRKTVGKVRLPIVALTYQILQQIFAVVHHHKSLVNCHHQPATIDFTENFITLRDIVCASASPITNCLHYTDLQRDIYRGGRNDNGEVSITNTK